VTRAVPGFADHGFNRRNDGMHAHVGDHITIHTISREGQGRHGEVLEVLGSGDEEHYRVRWDDGHDSLYFPGPDAGVDPEGGS
jgi:Domain of unknown function (DUF1918)